MATLSQRYAAALYTLAEEQGLLDEIQEQATAVRNTLNQRDVADVMENPGVPRTEKRAFLQEIFAEHLHQDLFGLLSLMLNKGHEDRIVPAMDAFTAMVYLHQGRTNARLVSASEPDPGQIASLQDLLSRKLGKQVDISLRVDPSLIGGFYIYVDGYLIDRTISKQLHDLRSTIEIVL